MRVILISIWTRSPWPPGLSLGAPLRWRRPACAKASGAWSSRRLNRLRGGGGSGGRLDRTPTARSRFRPGRAIRDHRGSPAGRRSDRGAHRLVDLRAATARSAGGDGAGRAPRPCARSLPSHSGVALVGAPNCGKTALFNRLTGSRQKVANYPGVTVERKEGRVRQRAPARSTALDRSARHLQPGADHAR